MLCIDTIYSRANTVLYSKVILSLYTRCSWVVLQCILLLHTFSIHWSVSAVYNASMYNFAYSQLLAANNNYSAKANSSTKMTIVCLHKSTTAKYQNSAGESSLLLMSLLLVSKSSRFHSIQCLVVLGASTFSGVPTMRFLRG